ncbi:MAG: hypothetical protein OXC69_04350 [Candidatus Tectomicrobia bacterium]|nr:hypothetical protein [Candidatus Tectomicrobia bacterium]
MTKPISRALAGGLLLLAAGSTNAQQYEWSGGPDWMVGHNAERYALKYEGSDKFQVRWVCSNAESNLFYPREYFRKTTVTLAEGVTFEGWETGVDAGEDLFGLSTQCQWSPGGACGGSGQSSDQVMFRVQLENLQGLLIELPTAGLSDALDHFMSHCEAQ